MSTDIIPADGDVITDDYIARTATPRDRLRGAILNVEEETARLEALIEARDRAREEGYLRRTQLSEAQDALQRAQKSDPQRIAYAYLNGDSALVMGDAVAEAKQKVADAQADVDQIDQIEAAIQQEIERCEFELRQLRVIRNRHMAQYLASSEELGHLLAMHKDCWMRLRSVKAALKLISEACHGQLPSPLDVEWNRSEPLEADRIGYPINEGFVEEWARTLADLERSADIDLPLFG